jgi:hypothetical protein
VGLAAREIEAAGITTVALSMLPDFTASVGAPRVAAIAYPFSQPLGRAGDPDGQRAVLRAALAVAERAARPGAALRLPFEWPADVRARQHPHTPPPIVTLLKRKPWLLLKFRSGDIPDEP